MKEQTRVLLIDNYDSFTYNLVLLVKAITGQRPVVARNDRLDDVDFDAYDKILLSPGPGIPSEAGALMRVIKQLAPTKSILGVCLGHQAIAAVFGARLENRSKVYHGKATTVFPCAAEPLFAGLVPDFEAGRYHSWTVSREQLPEELVVTAEDGEGCIMALRHQHFDVKGLQFHPESILTPHGSRILEHWLQ